MKKISLLFAVLLLFSTLLTGCHSNKTKIKVGDPVYLSELPIAGTNGTVDRYIFETFDALARSFSLDNTAVIRGKKLGKSIPVEVYDEDGYLINSYCETLISVSEVFYGNLQKDTTIALYETIYITKESGKPVLYHLDGAPPIDTDEYLFILNHPQRQGESGYFLCGSSYHVKIGDYQTLKDQNKKKEFTSAEQFAYQALDHFLNSYDPRIDIHKEAAKLANIDETFSQEEVLNSLNQEQKALLNKMISQYGSK